MDEPSFAAILEIHKVLQELFLQHQEALLGLDLARAQERLGEFERRLRHHVWEEEEILLPIYARAGTIPGGPPVLFTGEHKRMREFLDGFREALATLAQVPEDPRRGVLRLLDRQASFKNLVEHHNLRETNLFYPALDRVTTAAERRGLLARCGADRP